jgi:hypothetical protein
MIRKWIIIGRKRNTTRLTRRYYKPGSYAKATGLARATFYAEWAEPRPSLHPCNPLQILTRLGHPDIQTLQNLHQ